jgi:hypothetical protein
MSREYMRSRTCKYLAWGIWHSTDDPCLRGHPISHLSYRHAREDANEQFPVQSIPHAPLVNDRMGLIGLTAIEHWFIFPSHQKMTHAPEKNNIGPLDHLDVVTLDNFDRFTQTAQILEEVSEFAGRGIAGASREETGRKRRVHTWR